ncbi:nuclear migration protein unc-83 [Ditylenchus destructor]|nr:nuclear migration protein unc-83 [Ditylenchus destructor]
MESKTILPKKPILLDGAEESEDWTMSDESNSDTDLEGSFKWHGASSVSDSEEALEFNAMAHLEAMDPSSEHKKGEEGTDSMIHDKIEAAVQNLHGIFIEGCSTLYNDIRNALDELDAGLQKSHDSLNQMPENHTVQKCIGELEKRQAILMRQADQLAGELPHLADTLNLRLLAVGRAMEQLKIKQSENEQQNVRKIDPNKDNSFSCLTIPAQFRKWLQSSEQELEAIKEQISNARDDLPQLQRLRASQQVLQLQIETDGRALYNSAHQQLKLQSRKSQSPSKKRNSASEEKKLERWRCNFEALEHRWWAIWLASLENLELIGHLIQQLSSDEDEQTKDDLLSCSEAGEPLRKRRRTSETSATSTNTAVESPLGQPSNYSKGVNTNDRIGSAHQYSHLNHGTTSKKLVKDIEEIQGGSDSDTIPFHSWEYEPIRSNSSSPRLKQRSARMSNSKQQKPKKVSPEEEHNPSSDISNLESNVEFEKSDHRDPIPLQANMVKTVTNIPSTNTDEWLSNDGSGKQHDVGYSSGENSIYEALNNASGGSDSIIPDDPLSSPISFDTNERAERCNKSVGTNIAGNAIVRSYYRTVPLDDTGVTDTESPRLNFLPDILLSPSTQENNPNLTDSLIVQVDNGQAANGTLDDFEEVMEIMDEQFGEQLQRLKMLRQGTQWRELKANSKGKRVSSLMRPTVLSGRSDTNATYADKTSCDASSEESDTQRQNVPSNGSSACLDSIGNSVSSSFAGDSLSSQRKRRHRRASQAYNGKTSTKLDNASMDQSVYVMATSSLNTTIASGDDENDFMSRSLNLMGSIFGNKGLSRHKLYRRKMHRSASDNAALCMESSNSFHAFLEFQAQSQRYRRLLRQGSKELNAMHPETTLWPSIAVKSNVQNASMSHQRRPSVESTDSTTSATMHDSGDAHYEWDEYRDPCDALMTTNIGHHQLNTLSPFSSNTSKSGGSDGSPNTTLLFSDTLIDDDYQSQLPSTDYLHMSFMAAILRESKKTLRSMEQFMKEQRSANISYSQLSLIQDTANDNIVKLNALIHASQQTDDLVDMKQINEIENLRNKWTKIMTKVASMVASSVNDEKTEYEVDGQVSDGQLPSTSAQTHSVTTSEGPVRLHTILEDMKAQLHLLNMNGSTCMSIDEIQHVVDTRKQILRTLLRYRDDLQQFAAEAQHQGLNNDAKVEAEIVDLLTLVDLVEKSLSSIESSTNSLEKLRLGFECLCGSFKSLENKIDKLSTDNSKDCEADMDGSVFTSTYLASIKSIESELELCQERMNTLETTCNILSSQLHLGSRVSSPIQSDFTDENKPPDLISNSAPEEQKQTIDEKHDEFFAEFSQLKQELNRLKSRFNNVLSIRIYTSTVDDSANDSKSNGIRKRRLSPKSLRSTTVGTQSEISAAAFLSKDAQSSFEKMAQTKLKTRTPATNGITAVKKIPVPSETSRLRQIQSVVEDRSVGQRLRTAVRDSRLVQLFLGCALALSFGLLLISWLVDDSAAMMNHWRWQFGPQLDYVRGPPPV